MTKRFIRDATLGKLIGVTRKQVAQLVDEGMPQRKDGTFDKEACLAWLVEHKLEGSDPKPADTVIYDRKKFAKRMGVTAQAVQYWEDNRDTTGFPGQANFYPLRACQEWRDNYDAPVGRPKKTRSEAENRIADLKADKLETELRQKRGELVNLDDVSDYLRRSVARHREILRSFADRLAKKFAERGFDADSVALCRSEAAEMIEDLQRQIHQDLIEHAEEDLAQAE